MPGVVIVHVGRLRLFLSLGIINGLLFPQELGFSAISRCQFVAPRLRRGFSLFFVRAHFPAG